jgi:hypothetical protein
MSNDNTAGGRPLEQPSDEALIETVRDEIAFYGDSATVMDRKDMLRVLRRVLADHAAAGVALPDGSQP